MTCNLTVLTRAQKLLLQNKKTKPHKHSVLRRTRWTAGCLVNSISFLDGRHFPDASSPWQSPWRSCFRPSLRTSPPSSRPSLLLSDSDLSSILQAQAFPIPYSRLSPGYVSLFTAVIFSHHSHSPRPVKWARPVTDPLPNATFKPY